MRNLFLLITILWGTTTFAQRNIRTEILNYQDSTYNIIDNGRQLVIDKIINNDIKKANEVFLYLINETNPDYVSFYPAEAIIISIATQNFKQFIKFAKDIQNFNKDKKKFPLYTDIYAELHAHMNTNKDDIHKALTTSALSEKEKNYIQIYLDYYFNENKLLNRQQIKKAIKQDPQGAFVPFLKQMKNLCTVMKMEIGLGYQHNILSGKLTETIDPKSLSNIMMEIDFFINRTYFSIYFGGRVNKVTTLKALPLKEVDESYSIGEKVHITKTGLALGYLINPQSKFKLYPYVDLGIMALTAKEYDEDENELFTGFMPGIGIKTDIVFRNKKRNRETFFIKPYVVYNTLVTKNSNFKGHMLSFSVTMGILFGPNL
ncbi:hypothetical protein EMN47_08065 [Prolixibacteraceae bacterium JC049]|nr:hypothetical protein [Prolixibacteraceae bacterium JC049]